MIDPAYRWHNEVSDQFLRRDYLLKNQTLNERVVAIAARAEHLSQREGFSDRVIHAIRKGWWSLSSPVWSNYGQKRGLPISCFGVNIEDSILSIIGAHSEVALQSKYGGGTSAYFGKLRPRGTAITNNGFAGGPNHYIPMFETLVMTVTQGSTREASMAAYIDIDHPDASEFMKIRDDMHPIQNIHPAVCISDEWMESMIGGDPDKLTLQAEILTHRANKGYPFIFFKDNVLRNRVDVYRDKGMAVNHSNLCTEILLPTSETESFVCCLASMNLSYYDEWRDTDAVADLVLFLDTVITDFIERAENVGPLAKAVEFARNHRALGIGVIGWHTYLQKRSIPFESMEAKQINNMVFKQINERAHEASRQLASEYGEPPLLEGYGRRNTTLTAIAPTVSSSIIMGQVSRSIEPYLDNFHIVDSAKAKYTFMNPQLKAVLEEYGMNTEKTWESIGKMRGSVQHLDFLSDHHKAVFKTFPEIDPMEVIIQAHGRQKWLDQGQSLNLFFHPSMEDRDRNRIIIEAWRLGITTLYYQVSMNAAQEYSRSESCKSCSA